MLGGHVPVGLANSALLITRAYCWLVHTICLHLAANYFLHCLPPLYSWKHDNAITPVYVQTNSLVYQSMYSNESVECVVECSISICPCIG